MVANAAQALYTQATAAGQRFADAIQTGNRQLEKSMI